MIVVHAWFWQTSVIPLHLTPQPPQLSMVLRSVSQVVGSLSQSAIGAEHTTTSAPPEPLDELEELEALEDELEEATLDEATELELDATEELTTEELEEPP